MARSTAPENSRNRVNRAGRAVRGRNAVAEDHFVIENFRASHAHILNAFQASLRNRARYRDITVAQRLKRRATIYDKLVRRPNFSLTEMQDIAGCRLIFPNLQALRDFRGAYHNARFAHRLISGDDRYDYIVHPKDDGYRGIHDVYEYKSQKPEGSPWNKLRIELQYRTIYQHAWATAVEVAGLLTDNEHKFGRASQDYEEFFCLTSEIIARTFEASNSCRPEFDLSELFERVDRVDSRIGILNVFRQYNGIAQHVSAIGLNTILIFNKRAEPAERTQIKNFDSFAEAVREIGKLSGQTLPMGSHMKQCWFALSQDQGKVQSRAHFATTSQIRETSCLTWIKPEKSLIPGCRKGKFRDAAALFAKQRVMYNWVLIHHMSCPANFEMAPSQLSDDFHLKLR